jgi:hypothetical protein
MRQGYQGWTIALILVGILSACDLNAPIAPRLDSSSGPRETEGAATNAQTRNPYTIFLKM